MRANQSPIDFFDPDLDHYPNFAEIERKYTVILHEGDCVYIPAFYFYQFVARTSGGMTYDEIKPSALMVSLKYKSNSALLNAFFDAVERGILS